MNLSINKLKFTRGSLARYAYQLHSEGLQEEIVISLLSSDDKPLAEVIITWKENRLTSYPIPILTICGDSWPYMEELKPLFSALSQCVSSSSPDTVCDYLFQGGVEDITSKYQ